MVLQYQEPISQVLNFFHKGKNDLECWFLVLIRTKVTPLFGNYLPFQHQDKGSMLTGLALFTRWRYSQVSVNATFGLTRLSCCFGT